MDIIDKIENLLHLFGTVSLADMDNVRLMNRIDTKFIVPLKRLPELLNQLVDFYNVLQIDEKRLLPYRTLYFDTKEHSMYIAHHNGQLNRYKIRKREYMHSKTGFLEIKFKSNKGRTKKKRLRYCFDKDVKTIENQQFISTNTPFDLYKLEPKIENFFHRITLVSKTIEERITVDVGLEYVRNDKCAQLYHVAIVEVKQNRDTRSTQVIKALRDMRFSSTGMSKYCVGTALMYAHIKKNRFKQKLRYIENMNKGNR